MTCCSCSRTAANFFARLVAPHRGQELILIQPRPIVMIDILRAARLVTPPRANYRLSGFGGSIMVAREAALGASATFKSGTANGRFGAPEAAVPRSSRTRLFCSIGNQFPGADIAIRRWPELRTLLRRAGQTTIDARLKLG